MRTSHRKTSITIAPSILSADFSKLGLQIKEAVKSGCPWIHLDIMDNHFVPNLTFGPPVVKALRKVSKKAYFDAHLMTEAPASLIDAFASAGVDSLTVHEEACRGNVPNVLAQIRNQGMKTGLSIKPNTPLDAVVPYLHEIDILLIMTVEPGFGGQALLPNCLNKIRDARRLRDKNNYTFKIQADGGINSETLALVVAAGAEILVAGSALFNDRPVAENVKALMGALA